MFTDKSSDGFISTPLGVTWLSMPLSFCTSAIWWLDVIMEPFLLQLEGCGMGLANDWIRGSGETPYEGTLDLCRGIKLTIHF